MNGHEDEDRHRDHGPYLVRPAEAARLLSIGKRKLWELTNCHAIPFLRIGRSLRYDVRDLEQWIDAQKVRVRECR